MKYINEFFKKILRKRKYSQIAIVEDINSIILNGNTIALVRKNDKYTWVKFKCPCGCGDTIILSLNPLIKPYWTIKVDIIKQSAYVTLSPSVYLTGYRCKSHFFILNNKVKWV